MRVLVVKTSSLGDVIHTLPALTDAANALKDIRFDWVVEEGFQTIPSWHPQVETVIPCAIRRWRKHPVTLLRNGEWQSFKKILKSKEYDVVIDAQGLIKSAWLTWHAKTQRRAGFSRGCAREPLASWAYHETVTVDPTAHAIQRVRQLFAKTLGYDLPDTTPDYGLAKHTFINEGAQSESPYLMFLHGTTWDTKLWPLSEWQTLATLATHHGLSVKVAWGNEEEKQRAEKLSEIKGVICLPRANLTELAGQIAQAAAIVSVDTGLGHLAAALNVPTLSLYGATDATRTGTRGALQYHLQSQFDCSPCLKKTCPLLTPKQTTPPCYNELPADRAWRQLNTMLPAGIRL